MIILGIDPGVNGAIAVLSDGALDIIDVPTVTIVKSDKKRREVAVYELARIIDNLGHVDHAFIERVGAMPRDGAVGAFAFGGVYWALRMAVASAFIPQTICSPVEWRNGLRIPRAEKPGDKTQVVARANELFPKYSHLWVAKCHADRAEAALIAEHGRRVLSGAS